jgi:hypothetical protein
VATEETKDESPGNDEVFDDEFWLPMALICKVCTYLPFKTVCRIAAVSVYHNQCVQQFFQSVYLKKQRAITGDQPVETEKEDKPTNWILKFAKQFLNRLASVQVDGLKLNPHVNPNQVYCHELLGKSSPFLSDIEPASLKQIVALGIEQAAFVFKTGVCTLTPPSALSDTKTLKHIHNWKEETPIAVTSIDGIPRADLPFLVDYLTESFHDFLCLLKDGSVIQCSLVCR